MMADVYGQPLCLDAPFDFSFLGRYGRPFQVLPGAEKGLVCFGVDSPRWGKLFIRFAGAPLSGAGCSAQAAIARLQATVPLYQALRHPALVSLRGHGAVAGGYMAIFNWVEGESLYQNEKLFSVPLLTRLNMLDSVFDFHTMAVACGYASGNFCDGNLRANLPLGRVTLCNIDGYSLLPYENTIGRLPGSARFRSPEERTRGALVDGLSTQFHMGALAFAFFGTGGSWAREHWTAGEALFQVAQRACQEERSERYPSMRSFLRAWRTAAGETTYSGVSIFGI